MSNGINKYDKYLRPAASASSVSPLYSFFTLKKGKCFDIFTNRINFQSCINISKKSKTLTKNGIFLLSRRFKNKIN